ncbi:MAG: hypothetical protein SOW08_12610 [Lachnospiraceae bacterium]|nr:hypothetical protein [Lachnospiraceae bacterium]
MQYGYAAVLLLQTALMYNERFMEFPSADWQINRILWVLTAD